MSYDKVIKLIKEFKKNYPKIKLDIISSNSNDILDKIYNYEIDIGVIGKPLNKNFKSNIFSIPYLKQNIVIIAGKGHKFYGKYLDCGSMSGYIKSGIEISKL